MRRLAGAAAALLLTVVAAKSLAATGGMPAVSPSALAIIAFKLGV